MTCFLVLFSLPANPYFHLYVGLDDSWRRALNLAIKNHLVFGTQYILTYGPLGFLETRNQQFIPLSWFLAGDAFLAIGFYLLIFKYFIKARGWFFLLFLAILFLRDSYYCHKLFLILTTLCALEIKNKENYYPALLYCAVSAAMFFYIKLSFGLFAPILLLFLLLSIRINIKAFILVLLAYFGTLLLVYLLCEVDLKAYLLSSIDMVRFFSDAASYRISFLSVPIVAALLFLILFLVYLFFTISGLVKQKELSIRNALSVAIPVLSFYLLFKASFTRADPFHYMVYFQTIPCFMIFIMLTNKGEWNKVGKALVFISLLISFFILGWEQNEGMRSFNLKSAFTYFNPLSYFINIGKPFEEDPKNAPGTDMGPKIRELAGKQTIDIIPTEVATLELNGMNYDPRPVAFSNIVFTSHFDSLNAQHYFIRSRPEFLLMANEAVDKRNPFWDDPLAKAVIYLNYRVEKWDTGNDGFVHNEVANFLLFKSRQSQGKMPVFEKAGEITVTMGEKIDINFPDSEAVYIQAEAGYNLIGKIIKFFYGSPLMAVTLYYEDGTSREFSAFLPVINQHMLINKSVSEDPEFENFFTGNLRKNKNVKAFRFHPLNMGLDNKIKITFSKFVNY